MAVQSSKGKKLYNGEYLIRLSQEKTAKLEKRMGKGTLSRLGSGHFPD
jgi:hypothetical protein